MERKGKVKVKERDNSSSKYKLYESYLVVVCCRRRRRRSKALSPMGHDLPTHTINICYCYCCSPIIIIIIIIDQ